MGVRRIDGDFTVAGADGQPPMGRARTGDGAFARVQAAGWRAGHTRDPDIWRSGETSRALSYTLHMPISISVTALALCLFATIGCASSPQRQAATRAAEDRSAILDVVQAFFDTMAARDADAAAKLLIPAGVFVNVRPDPATGARVMRHFTNADYVAQLRMDSEVVRERMVDPLVLQEGDVATVWTRYTFERSGALSHTGFDAFNLVRTAEGWKIAGGVYSVVPASSAK